MIFPRESVRLTEFLLSDEVAAIRIRVDSVSSSTLAAGDSFCRVNSPMVTSISITSPGVEQKESPFPSRRAPHASLGLA